MKKIGFPAAVVAGGFALTTLIAGCGGGGGSTQTETPQNGILSAAIIPGPSLKAGSLDLVSPVETNVAITGTFTVVGDVGTVTAVPTLFVCGSSQTITATASVTGLQFALVNTVLPDGVTCNLKVRLTGSKANADGTYPTAEPSYQFDTKAKAVDPLAWWKANVPVAQGTVMYLSSANGTPANANGGLLPTDCKTIGDDCWKASVQNRTILCSASGGSDPAVPGIGGIEFCTYKIISRLFFPGKTMYCSKPRLASDGTFGPAMGVEDHCQVEEIISTVGNATGELVKYISATGTTECWQHAYDATLKGWFKTHSACPAQ